MRVVVRWAVASVVAAVLIVPSAAFAAAPSATLVSDIHPDGGSGPQDLTTVGEVVFFSATDGTHGRELWATDGTPDGTRLVRDIRPGIAGSTPRSLTRVGGLLYFSADDGSHGRELWVSDGTRPGTRLVRDLAPGAKGSGELAIKDLGGSAYFSREYEDLWRTDGTSASTRLVHAFKGIDLAGSAVMGAKLYFGADGALWKTSGDATGTKRISGRWLDFDRLTRLGRHLYLWGMFYGPDSPSCGPGETGCLVPPYLWWSDGTWAGTEQLGTIIAFDEFAVLGKAIYFNGQAPGSGVRLYTSDGSKAGTGKVVPRVRPLPEMQKRAGSLWATMSSDSLPWRDELWVSDATAVGTTLVMGGSGDWFTSDDRLESLGLDGRLWFAAGPGEIVGDEWRLTDHELWVSDGTSEGTAQAADINPTGSSFPRDFARLGGDLLFGANDGEHGRELWLVTP